MDDPTAPAAERPTRSADSRARTALVLLVLVLVLPLAWSLTGPPVVLGDPLLLVGAVAGGAAALAVAAAVVAPVGVGPRAAVAALAMANGGAGLWLIVVDQPTASLRLASLVTVLTGPLLLPALAWLGAALAVGLDDPVPRSWRTSLLLAVVIAGFQVLLAVVVLGTYGAALRFTGGFEAYVLVGNALAAAATVATLHVVVSVVRTWRAREGATVVPAPRTWVLVLTMTAAVALSVTAMLLSDAL